MMYSATLLVSLLASAHGFASTPDDPAPVKPVAPVPCERDGRPGETFFVYSIDPSQILQFIEDGIGVGAFPESVTHGLIGKTWEGVELSITQGTVEGGDHIQILQDENGGPLLMPSPNIAVPQQWVFVSGDFCLPNGNWTVKVNSPKYDYGQARRVNGTKVLTGKGFGLGHEVISYKPILDWAMDTFNFDLVTLGVRPFELTLSIFPAGKRQEAEAAAASGFFSLGYINDNLASRTPATGVEYTWATCEVNFTQNYWVPAPDHTCWEWYDYDDARNYPQGPWGLLTPEKGPCPRPESGSGDEVNEDERRRLSSDEAEPERICSR